MEVVVEATHLRVQEILDVGGEEKRNIKVLLRLNDREWGSNGKIFVPNSIMIILELTK